VTDIERAQAERKRFLRRVCEVSGANPLQPVQVDQVAAYVDITPEKAEAVVEILANRGLLNKSTFGNVTITPSGIEELEKS
jgi:Mn-dependent DtxR family transcriptional regulator